MKEALEVSSRMVEAGVIGKYAISGAVAADNYIEASVTEYLDILLHSTTAPGFRGRDLDAAPLSRRWQDASGAKVEFVRGGADYLSTSHRNMERSGLRLLFPRAAWTPLD